MSNDNKFYYKELIEKFCDDKGYSEKQKEYLLKPCIYEKDLFNMMAYEYGSLVLDNMCGRGKGLKYLEVNYLYITHFFDWCVEKRLIPKNPYKVIPNLSFTNLAYHMTEKANIKVLYEDDLQRIVNNISCNKELYAVIIGLLFDGIENTKELASIKCSDINIADGTLTINNRSIVLSLFTESAIEQYNEADYYIVEKSNISKAIVHEYKRHKDYFIKKAAFSMRPDLSDDDFVRTTAKSITKYLKKMDLSYLDINKSGMISALRKEFSNWTDEEFCEIFISENKINAGISGKLKKVMKLYNKSRTNDVINGCFPYIVNSKYYHV